MAAPRTLWAALVGLSDETLLLVGANLAALALNVPVVLAAGLLTAVAATASGVWPSMDEGAGGVQLSLGLVAWLVVLLPTPGNVALGGLTQGAAGPDVPSFTLFRTTFRKHWRLALRCALVSLGVLGALLVNVYFYAVVAGGWVRFVSVVWLYGLLLWLSLHVYLVPLLVHITEPRLVDLYRRAALVALGHPWNTLVLVLFLLAAGLVSVVFLPAYVLVGPAYISLAQAHAFREVRRRHGDLLDETEDEVRRL